MEVLRKDFQKIKRLIDSDFKISAAEQDVFYLESGTLDDEQKEEKQLGLF